jgi:hypothetical protein
MEVASGVNSHLAAYTRYLCGWGRFNVKESKDLYSPAEYLDVMGTVSKRAQDAAKVQVQVLPSLLLQAYRRMFRWFDHLFGGYFYPRSMSTNFESLCSQFSFLFVVLHSELRKALGGQ